MSTPPEPELRVGVHVLVQLGSELVTDVEQAILECVKNAYDADAPGCRIEIDTRETGTRVEPGTASKLLRFDEPSETVSVQLFDSQKRAITGSLAAELGIKDDDPVERHLRYTGRITIEDKGQGMTRDQLLTSWLVISGSVKRVTTGGPKKKTPKGRTPLGDKGLGRLGSMKLGDILLVETSTSPDEPIASAQFRWTDCEEAATIDEIPVYVSSNPNTGRFKGTRISVLGLKDLPEWRRKDRILEITRSLARLVSPFESTSTFPVGISLDGVDQSLVSVTEDLLNKSIAEFMFRWEQDPHTGVPALHATAKFRKRLFTAARSGRQREKAELAFNRDNGTGFKEFLKTYSRMKQYDERVTEPEGDWFIELRSKLDWSSFMTGDQASVTDPGPFRGAFYFFHLDDRGDPDTEAALPLDRELVKSMAGISILRDGFRVRSDGDWLGLSGGMTSGSTYHMRVNNTIGYFALTGEANYALTEKSDREGFVEDASYRGFFQIASKCKDFANDALENIRRGFDEHYRRQISDHADDAPITAHRSISLMEESLKSAQAAKTVADDAAGRLLRELADVERDLQSDETKITATTRAVEAAKTAIEAIDRVRKSLDPATRPNAAINRLRQELEDNREQVSALFESAAVGLSARGLAHELRTHLGEIRQRTTLIQNAAKADQIESTIVPHLRAIRGACVQISKAAALIDPMLPRTRAIKENFSVAEFVNEYIENRKPSFERDSIQVNVSLIGNGIKVRMNRSRLLQVLDNLVRNSVYWIKRSQQTGNDSSGGGIEIAVNSRGFVVSDSGPGVDPRYEDSLFEIFVTGKPERDTGQGLGLFIIRNLLHADGCDVELLPDRNDQGRRFRFAVNLRTVAIES